MQCSCSLLDLGFLASFFNLTYDFRLEISFSSHNLQVNYILKSQAFYLMLLSVLNPFNLLCEHFGMNGEYVISP